MLRLVAITRLLSFSCGARTAPETDAQVEPGPQCEACLAGGRDAPSVLPAGY